MGKRKRIGLLLLLVVLSGLGYGLYQYYQPPLERQQIRFVDSAQSMEDSMRTLRQICQNIETIKAPEFMNCYVRTSDSVMSLEGKQIGRFDTLTFANSAFKDMEPSLFVCDTSVEEWGQFLLPLFLRQLEELED